MRRFVGFAGWLAATVLASAVSLGTISLLGNDITDRTVTPISSGEVDRAFAKTGADPAVPAGPLPATVAGATRAFSSSGGIVLAQCNGEAAFLRSWSPAQGYAYDEVVRGPAPSASIEFDSDDRDVIVRISCRTRLPVATTEIDNS